ncbi:adenine nucleotide alpha hydrolases-like protein [Patellaria atrata CBS 101060]|uniref:Diphthine--ammonia ligase n=1 Tax=Patellaria atrata CBS 101060 TaxID=1346257 RepID=A0A9P4SJ91_9PEZI|nr:adenine nucleotide alpha hydrolases-like protein [Patellaria atrata CBS 101060]
MSSDRLNVIALISGGKDSFFSILHVLANGHRVVALANLHPSDTENEDTNSFMYQTVGHTVIPLYERALALPLFRQPIAGSAVNTSSTYALEGEGDETEDLIPLLRRIREAVPEANSVSTGAILSTYQRTRVESVAVRMGLVPLSYLWQFPYLPPYRETSLLGDMRAVGQEARIVKVCSGGLDEECLWSDVGDVRTVRRLRRGMRRFRSEVGAVLGEGGEFETLALKGPRPLWKGVIEVGEKEVVKEEGGSSFVKLRDVKVVELGDKEDIEEDRLEKLRIPDFLDVEFKTVLSNLSTSTKDDQPIQSNEISTEVFKPTPIPIHNTHSIHETPSTLHISNMISSQPLSTDPPEPTVQQLHSIFHALRGHLTRYNLNPTSIVSSLVLLRSMSDFAPLNPIYASFFPTLNPAARITIATGTSLPPGINIALSVIVDKGPAERRRILHVQSRSYWAPANIGPYSQAVGVPVTPHLNTPNRIQALNDDDDDEDIELKTEPAEIVHIAGQIPLVPATMTPVSSSLPIPETGALETQAALALQHLFRIGRAIGVDGFGCAIAFLSACGVGDSRRRAGVVGSVWRGIHAVTYEGQHGRRADEGEDGGKEEDDKRRTSRKEISDPSSPTGPD